MRRAITFFIISTVLFLLSEGLMVMTGNSSELRAGIFSIFVALFYIVFPVFSTKLLALLPEIPLAILLVGISIPGFIVILSICMAEFFLPVGLGYFVLPIVRQTFQTIGVVLTTICLITAWLLLRKQQWKLIQETWEKGFELLGSITSPISELMQSIWKKAEKIGEGIRS